MGHLKRLASPKTWPIPRKGTKYVTRPYPGKVSELSLPLGIVIKDVLKLARTTREVRIMLHNKEISVDGKTVFDTKFPVGLFDVLSIQRIKKNYRVVLNEKRKLDLEEVKDAEVRLKVCKVVGKTTLGGKKMQVNLFNGLNVLSDMKVKINDSVVVDLAKKTISKHLPLRDGARVLVVGGKHLGQTGKIENVAGHETALKIGKEIFKIEADNVYVIG